MEQSRRWCWTLNNPTEEEEKNIQTLTTGVTTVSYLTYGKEKGESGTPHFQGYLELSKKLRLGGVKKLPGLVRAHWETALGTQEQAIAYCNKEDGEKYVSGTPMKTVGVNLKTRDLMISDLMEGATPNEIALKYPSLWLIYHRGLCDLFMRLQNVKPREEKTKCKVYIGRTGTGKSRRAHEHDKIAWTHGGDRWFDGYSGQEFILFDDFDGIKSGITYRKLLQLLDRYQLSVPIKGAFVNWKPSVVVITTNIEINDWYPGEDPAPLWRRIDQVVRFTGENIMALEKGEWTVSNLEE